MTMQMRELVLYSHDGRTRRLCFRLGALNVVTGDSATGKSAITHIVDYCLGRNSCPIPAMVIRDAVSWYGLLLQLPGCQVFVARASPIPPKTTNFDIYYDVGDALSIPTPDKLIPNHNPDTLNEYLTRLMGVAPNLHTPQEGQTREPLQATLRHAKFLTFQLEDEIKTDLLFHRQNEPAIAQAIKDTLPYFLGVVPEDRLKVQQELREARRRLKQLERRLAEAEAVSGDEATQAAGLLREAQAVGLHPAGDLPADAPAILEALRAVRFTSAAQQQEQTHDEVRRLRQERDQLHKEHTRAQRELAEAEEFAAEAEGFAGVVAEQRVRLESLNLFGGRTVETPRCPLCQSDVTGHMPKVEQVRRAIEAVTRHVQAVGRERPDLREFISGKSADLSRLAERMRLNRDALQGLAAREAQLRQAHDLDIQRSWVAGQISLFVRNLKTAEGGSELRRQVQAAQREVDGLEGRLCEDESEELLRSALNQISQQVTRWCEELHLEYGKYPLRLHLPKLTLIADTDRGPIPMAQIGSGHNRLWFHLAVYIALHRWFIQKGRPVPRFLILDQPTQVYYPRDQDAGGSLAVLNDTDREWVIRLFEWLNSRVTELEGQLQVIITDHAEVDAAWFADTVVERWRDGAALVPADWPRK
jgi:hypothetical protein